MAGEYIVGEYKLTKSENFDEFLKELGMNIVKRKVATASSPTVSITQDGDYYKIKTASTFKTSEIKFKPGEEFEEERQDDAKVKSTITFDGNKLTHIQKGDKDVHVEREFDANGMVTRATINGVTSTRHYKRA